MENNQRVVWSEGMLLTPQLFQQWDQSYEWQLNERFHALIAFGSGALRLDFDHDGLSNGRVTLLGFHGVLPDGLIVKIPEDDSAPQTRLIGDLLPDLATRQWGGIANEVAVLLFAGLAASRMLTQSPQAS